MNEYSMESFSNWCDNMMIAEEAVMITKKEAKAVSDENSLLNAMYAGVSLIKFTGKKSSKLADKVRQEKADRKTTSTFIALGLLVMWPFLIPGAMKYSNRDARYDAIKKYKVITDGSDVYIIHKGYKLNVL